MVDMHIFVMLFKVKQSLIQYQLLFFHHSSPYKSHSHKVPSQQNLEIWNRAPVMVFIYDSGNQLDLKDESGFGLILQHNLRISSSLQPICCRSRMNGPTSWLAFQTEPVRHMILKFDLDIPYQTSLLRTFSKITCHFSSPKYFLFTFFPLPSFYFFLAFHLF